MTRPPRLRAALLLLALATSASGCDYIYDNCLYDEVGCALPGDWRLVSRNGEPATGRWEIAEGFIDRSGYGVLPTGSAQYPEMRGPFQSSYSLDDDDPQGFDLQFWQMSVENGTVYVDLYGRIESLDGDRMTYVVQFADAKIIPRGGGSVDLGFPLLDRGTRLVFER